MSFLEVINRKVHIALIQNLPSLECVHLLCEVGSVGILPSSVLFLELGLPSALCWKEGKGAYQCSGNDWDQGMQQFLSGSPVSVPHNGLHTRKRARIHPSHQIKATSQPIVSRAKRIANLGGEKSLCTNNQNVLLKISYQYKPFSLLHN